MKKKHDFYNTYMARLGLFLHPNFSIHIIIVMVLNLISTIVVVGTSELIGVSLINYNIIDLLFYVIVFSLIEVSLKIFILRYFIDIIFKTKGIFTFLMQVIIFYVSTFIVEGIKFNQSIVLNLLIYTILFFIIRIVLIILYQRYIMGKKSDKKGDSNE